MPIYVYECDHCHGKFEVIKSFTEIDKPEVCPDSNCDSVDTKRIPCSTSFNLKGRDWPGRDIKVHK